jgi:uncharacterized protein YdeI (YjbR/CyaY-like superfamily)
MPTVSPDLGPTIMYEQLSGVNPSRWFSLVKNLGLDKVGATKSTDWKMQQKSMIELKRIGQITRKYLEEQANSKPNTPFVQVQGIGYIEVPTDVVVKLSQPGVILGTSFGTMAAADAYRYLNKYGLSFEDGQNVLWVGSAKDAVTRIKNVETNSKS